MKVLKKYKLVTVLRNDGCQKFNPVDFKTTLDLS